MNTGERVERRLTAILEGHQWVRRLLEVNPTMTIAGFKAFAGHAVPGTIAVWVEGFRKAGLPEE